MRLKMETFRDTPRQQETDETDGRTVPRIWFSNCWRALFSFPVSTVDEFDKRFGFMVDSNLVSRQDYLFVKNWFLHLPPKLQQTYLNSTVETFQ